LADDQILVLEQSDDGQFAFTTEIKDWSSKRS
jgi:hypothetical protein